MADTSNRIAGVVYFTIDGVAYAIAGDFTYSPSLVNRESMIGQDGVHGYKEMPVAPYISGTLRDVGGLTVADINGMTNNTITAELANGKLIIGRNMWTTGVQEVKSADATFEVKWEGVQGAVTEN